MSEGNVVLNITQLFQLAAIGPCFFVAFYLLASFRQFSSVVLPALYFLFLGGSFLLPILTVFPETGQYIWVQAVWHFSESLLPELSFLLILQFILGKPPSWHFWLILAVPLVGGSSFIYLAATQPEICILDDQCYRSEYFLMLYRIFSASLVFMLLLVLMSRSRYRISNDDMHKQSKYWLVISLIMFNLLYLGVDLALVFEELEAADAVFVKTMIGVAFVYIVLSSVFRVFAENFGLRPFNFGSRWVFLEQDRDILEKMEAVLEEERPYRILGFNRRSLAERLGVKEYQLSRVINCKLNKSFSELMNECRVNDAKQALRETDDAVTVISFDTGFSSITSFNRVFKEATGVSPSEYRTKNRKEEKK